MPDETGKIKIRVPRKVSKGQIIPVKARIMHPMETGFRKDEETGKTIPAYYINDVSAYYGNDLITHFDWTFAVSKNPFLSFYLRADRSDSLKIVWKDNKGGVYEKTVRISPQ